MHYLTVSFSHKNSDIAVREKLAFNDETKEAGLKTLTQCPQISEAVIVSTCNRVEIIVSTKDTAAASESVFKMLSSHSKIDIDELEGRADVFENEGAIHHLFSVTSSLDSIVIGEAQIAGQVKDAFKFAQERGYCAGKLTRAMQYAFRCAADVRNQTEIAKKPVSVSSAAVDKAKRIFCSLEGVTAVVVGTGEMGELACRYLATAKANVILVSRTLAKANEMAAKIGDNVQGAEFKDLQKLLNSHPLLFSATSAPHPVIETSMVEHTSFKRVWFDISVPRDIEIGEVEGVEVITVDDLNDIVEQNQMLRAEEARTAYSLVGSYTIEFFKWINTLSVDPIIKELREKAQNIAEKELKNAIKKGFFAPEQEEEIAKLLHSAFKKFMHDPTVNLKALTGTQELENVAEALKYLHGLSDDAKVAETYKCEQVKNSEGIKL